MEQNDSNNAAQEQELYPLDEALIQYLADIAKARTHLQGVADKLAAEEQGALQLFSRQHKLQGKWQVAPNGRELVKQAEQPQPATEPPRG